MATWLAQPLLLFMLSLRSAENAVASTGMAEALANDVVKIGLAYLSSISVVVSAVTSTAAYRDLTTTSFAVEVLHWTQQSAQLGDVTYSTSIDCMLSEGVGAASVDQFLAVSLELPVYVLIVATLLIIVRACCRAVLSSGNVGLEEIRAEVLNKLFTCSLVAGNQFLPGVSSACMRAFPCFHIQNAVDQKGPIQFLCYDVGTECSDKGQYLKTCCPVLLLAFADGPAYWLTVVRGQPGAQQAGPMKFLTGSYRAGFRWWEAGRLSKSMIIASIVTASPTSYCPLQQLMLCLFVTVAFGFWHCFNTPYQHPWLNAAEAGSLLTLSGGMVLSGLLAGGGWTLTPSFASNIVIAIAGMLIFCSVGLAGLWAQFKFFWTEDSGEELLAEDS
ncbi:unnamed protein product [Prorocentrum cordatum]|uniref:H(+)-exporting diphosphatase n=1 Tax=Prorocentrum cordatum TaxID=2364126 RepID=A0ABN9X6L3_9DINO|nr:unnamed protein product [Polarella glacialis]